ncbi:hypothetical protein DRW41_18800 [Neobacillus piezotolerans]|uniref:Transposase n=1 Tax=Neobacillus piezotolerans TaxID=2259171 RepID=A0A3D8GLW7_9BACI|nr:hypothetical protein [Neobacillus piezotolerans]RDU35332.1 hypothetical protein DRW41_18800 [Neobacillus piezotolerans]
MNAAKEKKKTRKKNPPSEFKKVLNVIRSMHTPLHIIEVELDVLLLQHYRMKRIGEHLRVIRNTVLGELYKNYLQMARTKKYYTLLKRYGWISCELTKTPDDARLLEKELTQLKEQLSELRDSHNVTFDFARKYGARLREKKFQLLDAVTVWSVCEMAWKTMEKIMFSDGEKPYFYKKSDLITFQGKQAERCIILKHNKKTNEFYVSYHGMNFPLKIKQNDLFITETLSHIRNYYMVNGTEIDRINVDRHLAGKPILPTYRIHNNRIVRKEIRGKIRYFVQITLEGNPVSKRKKDGSFRHTLGTGRIGGDIGTQSIGIVSKDQVFLKNLAERSSNTFETERKIVNIQRYLDRSRRTTNPKNYNVDGTIKKGKKEWIFSKKYKKAQKKLRNLHRKATESRKYAHNEDINRLRSVGDVLIIETMNIKGLQKKAKNDGKIEKTGKWKRRKRFGKSILRRSPGYFIQQAKYRFALTGGKVSEINTWTFKASQYDHMSNTTTKKQLSRRWHVLPDGTKIQRDLYSAFLLYCSDNEGQKPDPERCQIEFENFLLLYNECIQLIINNRKVVLNSGIKIS